MTPIKALLIVKPWSGGLYYYLSNALKSKSNIQLEIIYTYPYSKFSYLNYLKNKKKWKEDIVNKINSSSYDIGIFVNYISEFEGLKNINKNILWLTDKPKTKSSILSSFTNIYLSDIGYINNLPDKNNFVSELPFAMDPIIHKPFKSMKNKSTICSIMNKDIKRDMWLKKLEEENIFPDVYGNYFFKSVYFFKNPLRVFPSQSFMSLGEIYAKYDTTLNIHAEVVRNGTNMSTFERAGYGVSQIVEYRSGIENYFEPDKEILLFSTIEEFKEKLQRIENDKKFRDKLADKSRKRALKEHTYLNRIDKILRNFYAN
tara:strand:- start:455 stop:1399 length:945 start_codon:yes stop_codon:yes gene_type:complete